MQNRTQNLITVVLALLFLGSVPLVLLSTAGYRINFRTRQLEHSGILILRSIPTDAHILLDGVLQDERTPARLSQLLPREYRVTVEREGYQSWNKLLTVESQRSAFAQNIVLFPDNLPERISDAQARTVAVSSDGTLAYDHTSGAFTEIRLRRPSDRREEVVVTRVAHRTGGEPELLLDWSPDGRTLLAYGDIAPTLVGTDGSHRALSMPGPLSSAVWSDQDLFLLTDGQPMYLPVGGALQAVTTSTAQLLWHQDGLTYLGRTTSSTVTVDVLAANGALLHPALFRITPGWNSRFIPSPQGMLTVLGDERIRVFDAATGALVIDREARGAVWRTDGANELLIWTDSELWTTGTDGNATLLTRLGAPIRDAAWYPGGTHVLYASGDTLSAIERDDRGGRIITPLFTLPGFGTFAVDEKGAAVFATAAPAGKPGIFRYPILVP